MKRSHAESGQSLVEYALILVLVAVAAIIVLTVFGDTLASSYTCILMSTGSQGEDGGRPVILEFTFVDANTEGDIHVVSCGGAVDKSLLGNSVAIRADTLQSAVGSVLFELTGPISHTQTENIYPYSLFGDNSGDLNGRDFPPGSYTLRATPYTQSNGSGVGGMTYVIQFKVADR